MVLTVTNAAHAVFGYASNQTSPLQSQCSVWVYNTRKKGPPEAPSPVASMSNQQQLPSPSAPPKARPPPSDTSKAPPASVGNEEQQPPPSPLPFPASVNLDPPARISGCIMDRLKGEIKKLTQILNMAGVALDIDSPYLDSYKTDYLAMNRHVPCTYGVGKLNPDGDINLKDISKIGSTSDAQRRSEEYKMKNMGGIILTNWNKYDGNVLNEIDKHIGRCYSIVADSFKKYGGFRKWISKATIQECRKWEDESGGLSIFFVMWMDLVLNHNGKKKRGVYKNLHIRTIEMANQLHYGIYEGAQFEQLHFDIWESFIIPNHEQVRRSTEQLMAQIREKLKLSANTDLRFKMHSTSVSWQHGVAFNTRQELTRKLNILFEGENIGEMGLKEMENILGQEKVVAGDDDEDCEDWEGNNLSVILEGIHDDQLVAVKNVDDLVELIYNAPDMNCEKQLFQSATEMFYDFFFNVVNSKMKGHWKDPYTDKPDIDNMYDASGLNHEEARENHRNTIQDLKITVDKCKEDRTVYVALMVSHLILLFASMAHCH